MNSNKILQVLAVGWGNYLQFVQVGIKKKYSEILRFNKWGECTFDFMITGVQWIYNKVIII